MKVILNGDIPNIGEEGEIKDVARGYARNYLIPKLMVMPYSRAALSLLENRREAIAQRRDEKRSAALDTKTRLEGEPLVIEMPAGERGRLFGSVTSATIADALGTKGISVERRRIDIPEKTIKSVGTSRVRIRLYGDEEAELRVVVNAAGAAPVKTEPAKTDSGQAPSPEAAPEVGEPAGGIEAGDAPAGDTPAVSPDAETDASDEA